MDNGFGGPFYGQSTLEGDEWGGPYFQQRALTGTGVDIDPYLFSGTKYPEEIPGPDEEVRERYAYTPFEAGQKALTKGERASLMGPSGYQEDYWNNPALKGMMSEALGLGKAALSSLINPATSFTSNISDLGNKLLYGSLFNLPGFAGDTHNPYSAAASLLGPLGTLVLTPIFEMLWGAFGDDDPYSKAQKYAMGKVTQAGIDFAEAVKNKTGWNDYQTAKWAVEHGYIPQATKTMAYFPEEQPGVMQGESYGGMYGPVFGSQTGAMTGRKEMVPSGIGPSQVGAIYPTSAWMNTIMPTQGGTYAQYNATGGVDYGGPVVDFTKLQGYQKGMPIPMPLYAGMYPGSVPGQDFAPSYGSPPGTKALYAPSLSEQFGATNWADVLARSEEPEYKPPKMGGLGGF